MKILKFADVNGFEGGKLKPRRVSAEDTFGVLQFLSFVREKKAESLFYAKSEESFRLLIFRK